MASQSSSNLISREERLLQLAEVGKSLQIKRLAAEEEALHDRADALKAYLDDGDEEALALTPAITLGFTVSPVTSKKPDNKSGRAVLNDVDGKEFVVLKNTTVVSILEMSQGFRRACIFFNKFNFVGLVR